MKRTLQLFQKKAEKLEDFQMTQKIFNSQEILYPWTGLEKDYYKRGLSSFPLVGYGSLINTKSAAKTLPINVTAKSFPVVSIGFRRIFNYEIPTNTQRYKSSPNSMARAALNVKKTGEVSDLVNGISFEINLKDISALRKREIDYDLVPVVCMHWRDIHAPVFQGFILRCRKRIPSKILPNADYYRLCREGALGIGQDFLEIWLNTTFLADGKTLVKTWEKHALSGITNSSAG